VLHGFLRFSNGTITTYDAPGAGTGPGQGSDGESINPAGEIAGEYIDANGPYHGFVRAANGTITVFDVPSAGTGPGQGTFVSTVSGITPAGRIIGFYADASNVNHGDVRAPDGTITGFDVPGAGTGPGQGTVAANINPAGAITGYYVDASGVNHGFVRNRHGAITTFDAPGTGTGPGQGTTPYSNNPTGAITGWEIDANSVYHGFLRNGEDDGIK
jgi:hypothetical protein